MKRQIQASQLLLKTYPIYTTGRTIPELIDNALEAANLYFEEDNIQITPGNLKFEIDFKQFFQYLQGYKC
ncbi:MAG: hypothetical protein U5L72_03380 [Bacteroidales bacterium]|nr:hypothetical protein [Bacteroidales bacterium]